MAQLALGLAGAALGSVFGGIGASIGWTIGAALGGLLDPQKQEGPRLADLRLQRSSYGGMVPIVWGTIRTPGNVIWQTDLTEHEHSSGGKGGGSEVTNFTYSASFAIALCEGPIAGVLRVWANGRLVWDTTQGSTVDSGDFQFALYLGDESQAPDPTMEADLGAGNVPAYLDVAYVVFTDLDLTDYGNTIPNLEFEVYTTVGGPIPLRISLFADAQPGFSSAVLTGQPGIPTTDLIGDDLPDDTVIISRISNFDNLYFEFYYNKDTGAEVRPFQSKGLSINSIYAPVENSLWAGVNFDGSTSGWAYRGTPVAPTTTSAAWSSTPRLKGLHVGNFFFFFYSGSPLRVARFPLTDEGVPAIGPDLVSGSLSAGHSSDCSLNFSGDQQHIFVHDVDTEHVFELDLELNVTRDFDLNDSPIIGGNFSRFYRYQGFFAWSVAGGIGTNTMSLTEINPNLTLTHLERAVVPFTFNGGPVVPLIQGGGLVAGSDGVVSLDGTPGAITLGEIVADISTRAGLDDADIDVTDLPDLVDGYIATQQGPARGMIEPLQVPWTFDAALIDDVVVFKHRGKPSIATIPDDELAAHEKGSELPAPITIVRTQEVDLPARVNFDYMMKDADYQTGSQAAERQVTFSQDKRTITVAIAMSDARAKATAQTQLFEAWLRRDKGSIYLPLKWEKLTPTDVITVKGRDWAVRKIKTTPRGVKQVDIEPSLGAVYAQPAAGAPSTKIGVGGTLSSKVDTDLLLFDIPLIGDADNANGFYAAMAPAAAGIWSGASLQRSADAGANYAELGSTNSSATSGETTTVLGDFGGGNVFDESNRVTVLLAHGSLAGTTATAILNGANECVIGDEIVQFRDATLIDTDTYVLSGLLRGRRGTEWAMSSHQVGDDFGLAPLLDVAAPLSDLTRERLYKAVTFGKTLGSASAIAFTNSGARLRPYAPVHLGGGIDGSGNVTLNWTRRTGIGGSWVYFTDVQLGETTESYIVQIWDSTYSLCARIITVIPADPLEAQPTATYSAAQQIADFGATQETIYFTVGQVGALGLGRNAAGTVPGAGVTNDVPLAPVTPYNNPTIPAGGAGSCTPVGDVINSTASWTTPIRIYSGAFTSDDVWVVQFTTGASVAGSGLFAAAEFGGGPISRTATIALSPCGTPLASTSGTTIHFELGVDGVELLPNTTYYVAIETASDGAMSADLIPNH